MTVPVAVLLLAMWAVHLRLHDPSWRTALPFFGAAALVLASTPLPFSELVTGAVLAVLVVVETRLAARRGSPQRDRRPARLGGAAGVRGEQPAQAVGQAACGPVRRGRRAARARPRAGRPGRRRRSPGPRGSARRAPSAGRPGRCRGGRGRARRAGRPGWSSSRR